MVHVKVRETYDLQTVKNKMTVIAIHTPKPDIIRRNYPGLLMQCKAYRPYSADVRIACASMMPLDVQSVGTAPGDVAPEDVFNPILYKAMSNFGMSQLEARINAMEYVPTGVDVQGDTALVDVDTLTSESDEFAIYYGLLANTHEWKHANPQAGLSMSNLKPLVWEMLYNVGDNIDISKGSNVQFAAPDINGNVEIDTARAIRGNSKPMPFINCLEYTKKADNGDMAVPGFPGAADLANNASVLTPYLNVVVGTIIIPPSRLHSLFFRMVIEWDLEFSMIRPLGDITSWGGLGAIGNAQHYQNYSYENTKAALTGSADTILTEDATMVSSNVDIKKVM